MIEKNSHKDDIKKDFNISNAIIPYKNGVLIKKQIGLIDKEIYTLIDLYGIDLISIYEQEGFNEIINKIHNLMNYLYYKRSYV
jgi:hypothetical protein